MNLIKFINESKEKFFNSYSKKLGYYLIAHSIFSVLIGTFEIAIAYRITNSILLITVLYWLFYLTIYIGFSGSYYILKLFKFQKMDFSLLFRIDLILQVFNCIYLILFFSKISNLGLLMIYFLVRGLAEGIYWASRHNATVYAINDSKRDNFILALQAFQVFVSMILPLVAGFIISYIKLPFNIPQSILPQGYYYIFYITMFLIIISIILSPDLNYNHRINFLYKNIFRMFLDKRIGYYSIYLTFCSIQGSALVIAIGILNFLILKTEFNLGLFSSFLSILATVYFYIFRKIQFIRKNKSGKSLSRTKLVLIGSVGEIVSRMIYFFFFSFNGLVIKSIIDTFIVPLKGLFSENIVKKEVEKIKEDKAKYSIEEIFLYQETLQFIVRTITFIVMSIFLVIIKKDIITVSKIIIIIFSLGSLLEYILLKKMSLKMSN